MPNWKNRLLPDSPPGKALHAKGTEPAAFVGRKNCASTGTGTSVPHLKGAGALLAETKSSAGAEGAAALKVSEPDVPATSVPAPASAGTPATPASPEPRSTKGERPASPR